MPLNTYTSAAAALLLFSLYSPGATAEELGESVRSAVDRVAPSIVRIRSVGTPDQAGKISSRVTTGVVVSADGEVVTSSFGLGDGLAAMFVETAAGQRHSAEVVAVDHVRKLVLLRTDAPDLTVPNWLDNDPPVGAWSIACGRFFDSSSPSAALGVISAVNRIYGLAIQTDAKVSPVNYGGPLIDMDGRVSGILVPLAPQSEMTGVEWYDSGIGFAVPARDVLATVETLRQGEDRKRGLLGIGLTTKNPLEKDIVVRVILPGSPAAKAGLQAEDRIIAANGIKLQRLGSLQRVLGRSWGGDTLELTIRRGDDELILSPVLVEELTAPPRGWLGLIPLKNVVDGDSSVAAQVAVVPDSPARRSGLPPTCRITKIGDTEVKDLGSLRSALRRIRVEASFEISYLSDDSDDPRTVTVQAVAIPDELPVDEILTLARPTEDEQPPEWTQSVDDLNEDTHLWKYAPKDPDRNTEYGLVFAIADGQPARDTLLSQWKDVCEEHRLVLAVIYRDYSLPLTSVPTIMQALGKATQTCTVDPDRMAIQAGKAHSLATRLLLNPRLSTIRLAVYRNSRPVTAGFSTDALRTKQPALLILSKAGSSQDTALLTSTQTSMKKSGASVAVRDTTDLNDEQQSAEIARWLILQKVH